MPKGEEHFWYSSKMRRELADSQPQEPCRLRLWTDGDMVLLSEGGQKYQPMYAQLADGRLVEYTECTPTA